MKLLPLRASGESEIVLFTVPGSTPDSFKFHLISIQAHLFSHRASPAAYSFGDALGIVVIALKSSVKALAASTTDDLNFIFLEPVFGHSAFFYLAPFSQQCCRLSRCGYFVGAGLRWFDFRSLATIKDQTGNQNRQPPELL